MSISPPRTLLRDRPSSKCFPFGPSRRLFPRTFADRLNRLATLDGDWHEFESKALRRENDRKEKEARRAAAAAGKDNKSRDRKRENEGQDDRGDAKRVHVESKGAVPTERPKA